jgi:N-acetyltransferase
MLTLENTIVKLEPLNQTHIPALLAIAQSAPEAFRLTTAPTNLADMTTYVESAAKAREQRKALPFATLNAKTGMVLGSTRFGNLEYWTWEEAHPYKRTNGTPDAAEIGWTWLTPTAQRTAINTNAKLLMLEYAFETWEVRRVTLKTNAKNHQSRNAILRIGASFEGILRSHMPGINGAAIRDTAMYSILESEWAAVKPQLQAMANRK